MQTLRDLGYTSLPISILVETIRHGGLFPERPVVITFDDGNEDIYSTAFPIMRRYGFVGTFYMVANRLGAKDFVNADQLIEMAAAGWEIGSHGYSHVDLTTDHSLIFHEMADSRRVLQEKLHVPVNTIAYPFGNVDATVLAKAEKYGYKAGLGLGTYREHTFGALYYLSRMEVRSDYDMAAFMALLPWTDKLK
jgi:peptidoglycan/xylan/chitin deacetylase (PgdA/CDA1 family)